MYLCAEGPEITCKSKMKVNTENSDGTLRRRVMELALPEKSRDEGPLMISDHQL